MSDQPQMALLQQWCDLGLEGLGAAREEIDALNVYPVPDGDTGTNLYLTFEAARQSLVDAAPESLVAALTVFARGALLGARGNSGVILSQLLRAGTDQLMRGDPRRPGALLADTLTLAADAGYDAVGQPVEGTILSVARAAADAAQLAVPGLPEEPIGQLGCVIRAAAKAAREALDRTPDQLAVLKAAGVVDAGGRGLCVLLDAAEETLTGRRPPPAIQHVGLPTLAMPGADLSAEGPGYEVMYLLDAEDAAVRELRRRLAALGDSLVVVGGDGLWNVHVHVDDVGAAIEAGIQAGHPHRLRVTHFADQLSRAEAARGKATSGRGVVAFAAGPGLADLFSDSGAVVVARQGARCSTGEILEAIRSTDADEVIVLPNDADTVAAAEAAARTAREEGVRVAVIPTRAQVQGLAAVAVREPGRTFDADVVAMTTAASHARHGAVTVAARDAMTMAGPCREGDTLGIVEGDFALVGGTLDAAGLEVVERLLAGGGELVTLVTGVDCTDTLVANVAERLERTRPDVELSVHAGGQPRYPLLIGVE
ncbi:MAG: DAK2 domain-containing protein [Nocardioidaceae bacterium]